MEATTEGDWINFSVNVTVFCADPLAFIVPNSKNPPPIAFINLLFTEVKSLLLILIIVVYSIY